MPCEQGAALPRLGLYEQHGHCMAAAIELMAPMRHHDRDAARGVFGVVLAVHQETARHRQGDLDRVMGMHLRAPGIAADPRSGHGGTARGGG